MDGLDTRSARPVDPGAYTRHATPSYGWVGHPSPPGLEPCGLIAARDTQLWMGWTLVRVVGDPEHGSGTRHPAMDGLDTGLERLAPSGGLAARDTQLWMGWTLEALAEVELDERHATPSYGWVGHKGIWNMVEY